VRLNNDTIIGQFPKRIWGKAARKREGGENLNRFCITVSKTDWEALVKRVAAREISIERAAVQLWEAQGIGTSIYFRDPENNLIEALYRETSDN